ncbi:MAG TPA: cytochrome c [Pirellulales bacterium]|jgi:mono/diheme cytochrome c family protein
MRRWPAVLVALFFVLTNVTPELWAEETACEPKPSPAAKANTTGSAQHGYHLLRTKPYLPAEFPATAFENIWRAWPATLKGEAKKATPDERRKMSLSRYGLPTAPEDEAGIPMAYIDDGRGGWSLTCLSCHGGKVAGRSMPGLGNSHFAFTTLTHEVMRAWMLDGGKPEPWQLSRLTAHLGASNGTIDAQVFSIQLTALRDDEMNVHFDATMPAYAHHDLDAPPLWNVKKKSRLYIDGFAEKTPRTIMQFALYPENDAATIKAWEEDFRDILAWIESLEAPKYPYEIDTALAAQGEPIFRRVCAECHGTYGPEGTYPEKRVSIDVVNTDPVRLSGMPPEHRRRFGTGWLGEEGKRTAVEKPDGYVAPPLDGVWASAPYLHNGSVPTLWHLFHSAARPVVWLRTEDGYDRKRVGLEVTGFDELPATVKDGAERRRYFDTRLSSKSAAGHTFPDELSEDEKRAVIEYLKTL